MTSPKGSARTNGQEINQNDEKYLMNKINWTEHLVCEPGMSWKKNMVCYVLNKSLDHLEQLWLDVFFFLWSDFSDISKKPQLPLALRRQYLPISMSLIGCISKSYLLWFFVVSFPGWF